MSDADCVAFLQWAMPRMGLCWHGFRRNRRQVCRRVVARSRQLGLSGLSAYAEHLERHPGEWATLEALCGVTISRFYRDRDVFDGLAQYVLPELARAMDNGRSGTIAVWSAGCASGEEPYSLALLWEMQLSAAFPEVALRVLATDRDAQLLERAMRARYRLSSLRELPAAWVARSFEQVQGEWCLDAAWRRTVDFELQDFRHNLPAGPFQLILCRNMAFSYFEEREQLRLLHEIAARLQPGGYLVIGADEHLPAGQSELRPIGQARCIYQSAQEHNTGRVCAPLDANGCDKQLP